MSVCVCVLCVCDVSKHFGLYNHDSAMLYLKPERTHKHTYTQTRTHTLTHTKHAHTKHAHTHTESPKMFLQINERMNQQHNTQTRVLHAESTHL